MPETSWFKMFKFLIFGEELNSLIIFEHERKEDLITITDEYRLNHLNSVLKIKLNQNLKISLLGSGLGQAEVKLIEKNRIELELSSEITQSDYPEWHLLVGLSRPPTMKKILEHATSLGVTHFHFFTGELSEKSYADSKIWEENTSQKVLLDGLSQSARYWKLPKISIHKTIESIPSFDGFDRRISSLSDGSHSKMEKLDSKQPLVLAFGPERGFTQAEDNALRSKGFQAFSLGQGVLRVEIAVFSALGQCHLLL